MCIISYFLKIKVTCFCAIHSETVLPLLVLADNHIIPAQLFLDDA